MTKQLQSQVAKGPNGKPVPDFVPKWMVKLDREFDPTRALRGAVRMGDKELAGKLCEEYGILDKEKHVRQAELNGMLLTAQDRLAVNEVAQLLDQGASAHAARWNRTRGEWFSALSSVVIVCDSLCWKSLDRSAAFQIGVLLIEKGADISFCEPGGDSETITLIHRRAVGLPDPYRHKILRSELEENFF